MPVIRLCARRGVVVVAASVIVAVLLLITQISFACPVSLTPTLRTLVLKSDRIVVASVGESVAIETKNTDYGGVYTHKRTLLHVATTAKGVPHESTIYLFHHVWSDESREERYGDLEEGKPLLLFLRWREEGDGYVFADSSGGANQLPDEDLKVYVRRIEELVAIMSVEKPDPREIVEWLVRCAEEPATRWDGAVELALSVAIKTAADKKAAADASKIVARTDDAEDDDGSDSDDNPVEVSAEMEVRFDGRYLVDAEVDATFAEHLTGEQQDRLAAVLLSLQKIDERELPLVALVESWKDTRLMPFLITHLRKVSDDPPYVAEELVMTIARMIDDEEVTKLAADYAAQSSYQEEETTEAVAAVESNAAETETESAVASEAGGETPASEEGAPGADEPPGKTTNRERRSALLARFIERVENQSPLSNGWLVAHAN